LLVLALGVDVHPVHPLAMPIATTITPQPHLEAAPPRTCIKLWHITSLGSVHASYGILWCRRTLLCRRRTNRSVSGLR